MKVLKFLGLLVCLSFIGCSFPRLNLDINQSEYLEFAEENNIDYNDVYFLEHGYIIDYLPSMNEIDTTKHSMHDFYQPMQSLFYDKNDSLISHNWNCAAWGSNYLNPMSLNWNRFHIYDQFPPVFTPYTHVVNAVKDSIINYLTPLMNKTNYHDSTDYDYTVFVFGGLCFDGNTEKLIEAVDKCIALDSSGVKIKKYFVITDELLEYQIRGRKSVCWDSLKTAKDTVKACPQP